MIDMQAREVCSGAENNLFVKFAAIINPANNQLLTGTSGLWPFFMPSLLGFGMAVFRSMTLFAISTISTQ